MRARRFAPFLGPAVGVLVLTVVVAWVGPAPLGRGLASVDLPTVAIALLATWVATVASALRWGHLAREAGLHLSFGAAVRAYYRSQLLNAVLPVGVLGDVERAVLHGRGQRQLRRAGRTVLLDRVLGQAVAVLLAGTLVALLRPALPRAVAWDGTWLPILSGACAVALAVAASRQPVVVCSSIVVALAHAATFVAAAVAVGVPPNLSLLLPLAVVVLVGGALPLNVAGWGPREGVAAWAFAMVGLGAGTGVAVSVAHGVLTLISVAPGLAFLGPRSHRMSRSDEHLATLTPTATS